MSPDAILTLGLAMGWAGVIVYALTRRIWFGAAAMIFAGFMTLLSWILLYGG